MDVFALAERAMRMDEESWARHANPWSVWTRAAILPLLVLAIWSRFWIGWWVLAPVATLMVFAMVNPRLFPPPRNPDNWASRATFGERVYLNRKAVPVPDHHRRAATILTLVTAIGVAVLAYGLIRGEATATVAGLIIAEGGKIWFVDRMVWLYADMCEVSDEYRRWLEPKPDGRPPQSGDLSGS